MAVLFIVLIIALAGVAWYGSAAPPLDWNTDEPPNVMEKVREMLHARSLSVSLDEAELNALLKPELYERRRLGSHAEITGADFALRGETMIVRTDIALWNRFRLQVTHRLHLSWDKPDIVAVHVSSSLRDIPLPKALFPIGVIRVPMKFSGLWPAELDRVTFDGNRMRFDFRLVNPFA